MAELLSAAATVAALTAAWEELLADDEADQALSAGTRRFADAATEHINELSQQLTAGTYRPGSLAWVPVPKPDGGTRELQIPRTRDRVVEKAIAEVLSPVIDALHVRNVARPGVTQPGGTRRLHGLAQGSPLSPMFANLFLEQLDERVRAAGFPLVRYGDDLVLFAGNAADARHALAVATAAVEEIGMSLGTDKTEVMSFDDGFCFLGEDFGPPYPPLLDEHRIEVPATKTLYVAVPGAAVRLDAGRITPTWATSPTPRSETSTASARTSPRPTTPPATCPSRRPSSRQRSPSRSCSCSARSAAACTRTSPTRSPRCATWSRCCPTPTPATR